MNVHQLPSLTISIGEKTHLVVLAETPAAGTVALPVTVSTPPSALVLTNVVPTTAEEGPAEVTAADDPAPVDTAWDEPGLVTPPPPPPPLFPPLEVVTAVVPGSVTP
jgi:hypothetical protein